MRPLLVGLGLLSATGCAVLAGIGDVSYTRVDAAANATDAGAGAADTDLGPPGPLGVVNSSHASAIVSASLIVTLPKATTAGNVLVLGVTHSGSSSAISRITDDAPGGSNAYVVATSGSYNDNAGCDGAMAIWYAKGIHAGATTVTVTVDSLATAGWLLEVSGLSPTSPIRHGKGAREPVRRQRGPDCRAPGDTLDARRARGLRRERVGDVSGLQSGSPFSPLSIEQGDDLAYEIVHQTGSYGPVWIAETSGLWAAGTVAFH
jgi:hypothetical protein